MGDLIFLYQFSQKTRNNKKPIKKKLVLGLEQIENILGLASTQYT